MLRVHDETLVAPAFCSVHSITSLVNFSHPHIHQNREEEFLDNLIPKRKTSGTMLKLRRAQK